MYFFPFVFISRPLLPDVYLNTLFLTALKMFFPPLESEFLSLTLAL